MRKPVWIIFFLCLFAVSCYAQRLISPDSLLKTWGDPSVSDSLRLQAIDKLSFAYINVNPKKADSLAHEGLKFMMKSGRRREEGEFYITIGGANFYLGNFPKAQEYYLKCIEVSRKVDDLTRVGAAYTNLAGIYFSNGEPDKAVEYYKKGITYLDTTKLEESHRLSQIYVNLANTFGTLGNKEEASYYYRNSIRLAERIGDSASMYHTKVQMIYHYIGLSLFDSAKVLLDKVAPYLLRARNSFDLAYFHMYNGYYFLNKKDYPQAIAYFQRANQFAKKIEYLSACIDAHQNLYITYRAMGKNDSALKYHISYVQLRDSLRNEEMMEKMMRKTMGDEYKARKLLDDKQNEMEVHKAEEEGKRQRLIAAGSVFVLGLVVVFALIIWNRLKLTRKQNVEIAAQKKVIEEKQKEIIDSLHYARRIQRSLLGNEHHIQRSLEKFRK